MSVDTCMFHPDRKATYFCQKDNTYMCEECACCRSPNIYCQFRTSCPIDFLIKDGELKPCAEGGGRKS